MTNEQKNLIKILNKSIKNEKISKEDLYDVDYEKLIQEIKCHNVSSLVYYTLEKDVINEIDDNILSEWKKEVFFSNIVQINHITEIKKVLNIFNEKGIKVILLKGLILRNLYPKPELRSMSDADILVENEQYDEAVQCLYECNYILNGNYNDIHQGFIKPKALEIEMHNKLINNDFFDVDFSKYEKEIWDNTTEIEIDGIKSNTLKIEDFIIHLILHMAVHSKLYGFGIRQVYDFAVFINYNYDKINWGKLKMKMNSYGFGKYTEAIILIINKLFNVNIPLSFIKSSISEKSIDIFISNIMNAGVHGKKELNDDFKMLYESTNHHKDQGLIAKRIVRFIFPGRRTLVEFRDKYKYVYINIFLLPIAWLDRIFNEYLGKYGFIQTMKFIDISINILKRRNKLIELFELPF
ncbi:nucleotidyltransferase domain-containing protein [Clostridium butyricum]|uniref:nucleotidyltransferase domain-containing protein n=1 Tax=Clostridium butyricum TaxID=1492 RepID=UPI003D3291BC